MDKHTTDTAYFVSWCIELYKTAMHLDGEAALKQLDQYGVLQYLADNFEVLHTQGSQWLLAEINEYIDNQKKETQS